MKDAMFTLIIGLILFIFGFQVGGDVSKREAHTPCTSVKAYIPVKDKWIIGDTCMERVVVK